MNEAPFSCVIPAVHTEQSLSLYDSNSSWQNILSQFFDGDRAVFPFSLTYVFIGFNNSQETCVCTKKEEYWGFKNVIKPVQLR